MNISFKSCTILIVSLGPGLCKDSGGFFSAVVSFSKHCLWGEFGEWRERLTSILEQQRTASQMSFRLAYIFAFNKKKCYPCLFFEWISIIFAKVLFWLCWSLLILGILFGHPQCVTVQFGWNIFKCQKIPSWHPWKLTVSIDVWEFSRPGKLIC